MHLRTSEVGSFEKRSGRLFSKRPQMRALAALVTNRSSIVITNKMRVITSSGSSSNPITIGVS
jgi:hypothetical protein